MSCDIDYGGHTFSYILDIKMHILVRTLYSQQLSLIRKIFKIWSSIKYFSGGFFFRYNSKTLHSKNENKKRIEDSRSR